MVHHKLRPELAQTGIPCTKDSSSLGARCRLEQDATNITQQGCTVSTCTTLQSTTVATSSHHGSYHGTLYGNMTSFTKPETHIVGPYYIAAGGGRSHRATNGDLVVTQADININRKFLKLGLVVAEVEICVLTDRQTRRHADDNTRHL